MLPQTTLTEMAGELLASVREVTAAAKANVEAMQALVVAATELDELERRARPGLVQSLATTPDHCIFCFKHRLATAEFCSYGLRHEFPEVDKPVQSKRAPKNLCTKCGLHPKNPVALANGCAHEYPA